MAKEKKQLPRMNTKAWIIAIAATALVIAVIYAVISGRQAAGPAEVTSTNVNQHYSLLSEDNRFVESTDSEVLKVLESGTGVVFLGFPECPWCQQLAPIVDEAAKAENLDKVYYLNIRETRANNDGVYRQLVEKLRDHLETDEDGQPRIFVPDVTAVENGTIVGRFKQEPSGEKNVSPAEYWTPERHERGVSQMREIIKELR